MREPKNIEELLRLSPDYIGFIFYEKSKRCIPINISDYIQTIDKTKKVGVFVNQTVSSMIMKAQMFGLDYLQLHSNETPAIVKKIKKEGWGVIKTISIDKQLPKKISEFEGIVDYFLFDTLSPDYGGSGLKFDWSILQNYSLDTPFFLSGGISLDDLDKIRNMSMDKFVGIDINSKFEISPGYKNISMIRKLKKEL